MITPEYIYKVIRRLNISRSINKQEKDLIPKQKDIIFWQHPNPKDKNIVIISGQYLVEHKEKYANTYKKIKEVIDTCDSYRAIINSNYKKMKIELMILVIDITDLKENTTIENIEKSYYNNIKNIITYYNENYIDIPCYENKESTKKLVKELIKYMNVIDIRSLIRANYFEVNKTKEIFEELGFKVTKRIVHDLSVTPSILVEVFDFIYVK